MYQSPDTALELNALYGEMTSTITQIKNIDLLVKINEAIKNLIAKATVSEKAENIISPALQAKIDLAREEHEKGETLCFNNAQDAIAWMESL